MPNAELMLGFTEQPSATTIALLAYQKFDLPRQRVHLFDCCVSGSNEGTAAFRLAPFDSDRDTVDGERFVSGDDFIYAMRCAAWIKLRTEDIVVQSGDCLAVYIVDWRAADDLPTMISRVTYGDNFFRHDFFCVQYVGGPSGSGSTASSTPDHSGNFA